MKAKLATSEKDADALFLMTADQGGSCVWSDEETRALNEVWAEESVAKNLTVLWEIYTFLHRLGKYLWKSMELMETDISVTVPHSWHDSRVWHDVSPLADCVVWTRQHVPSPGACSVHAVVWTCQLFTITTFALLLCSTREIICSHFLGFLMFFVTAAAVMWTHSIVALLWICPIYYHNYI